MLPMTSLSTNATKSAPPKRLNFILAVIFFRLALDLTYVFYVSPAFLEDLITPMVVNTTMFRYLISVLLVLPAAAIVPHGKENLSGAFFMSAMIFLYLPMTSMWASMRHAYALLFSQL